MTPKQYNFRPQYQGDTFAGVQMILTKTVGGETTPLDLTGAFISMDFRLTKGGAVAKSFLNNNGITIVDAVNGIVNIDKFQVILNPGKYSYELKITTQSGDIKTYLIGTFEVVQNLS